MIQSYQLTFALASKNDFPKNGSTSCISLRVRRSNRYFSKKKKNRLDQQIIRLAIIETTFLTTHANLFPQNLSYLKLLTHESLWNLFVRFTTTARLEEDIPRSEHILYVGQFNASSQETYTASCWTTAGDRKNLFEVGPNFSERDRNDGHVLVPLWRDNTFATPTHERERERRKEEGKKDNLSRRFDKFSISWLPPAWNVRQPKLETFRGWTEWKGWTPVDFDRRIRFIRRGW